jgi:hypothetical protein
MTGVIAVITDSEYRSPVMIHGGITIQRGFSLCQQSSSLSSSVPLVGTATGMILLHGLSNFLPLPVFQTFFPLP